MCKTEEEALSVPVERQEVKPAELFKPTFTEIYRAILFRADPCSAIPRAPFQPSVSDVHAC